MERDAQQLRVSIACEEVATVGPRSLDRRLRGDWYVKPGSPKGRPTMKGKGKAGAPWPSCDMPQASSGGRLGIGCLNSQDPGETPVVGTGTAVDSTAKPSAAKHHPPTSLSRHSIRSKSL